MMAAENADMATKMDKMVAEKSKMAIDNSIFFTKVDKLVDTTSLLANKVKHMEYESLFLLGTLHSYPSTD